ncbi:hypothetical protein AeMF1_020454 [Aphanomyces euteiches]|nr:hypothetical protein AeMF1_020454 [Aphanomyces euteiches]KAH9189387.1 hypothetical protein AeNC1_008635 [Aphanomyces euteiches]
MSIDIWGGISYVAIGISRVSQFQNLWLYVSSCAYLSRCVWFAYLGMQIVSFIVKRRRREALYSPVDPGLLAIATYIYYGVIMSAIATTPMAWLFYASWYVFLPSSLNNEATETITGTILVTLVSASLPLLFSRLASLWHHRKKNKVGPTTSVVSKLQVSNFGYNDLKAWFLLSLTLTKRAKRSTGGTLHRLYQENPRYRKLPLSSHRAADCFVLCYRSDGILDQQIRLSLLACLDTRLGVSKLAIQMCKSMHSSCVCTMNNQSCQTFQPQNKAELCIHRSDSDCQWIV